MKKWIVKSTLWATCLILFWVVIELLAGKEINDYHEKHIALYQTTADTIVLGSSHGLYSIKAQQRGDGGSYNLSWASQTLEETEWLTNEIHEDKYLFICISPNSLSSLNDNREESWRNVFFNRTFNALSHNVRERSYLLSLGGRKIIRMAWNGIAALKVSRIDQSGNKSQFTTNIDLRETALAACERHSRNPKSDVLTNILLNLCKRPKTVFFTPPFHSTYNECIRDRPIWKETLTIIDSLIKTDSITYKNYSSLSFPDSFFFDADHLNHLGQRAFSATLFNNTYSGLKPVHNAIQQP